MMTGSYWKVTRSLPPPKIVEAAFFSSEWLVQFFEKLFGVQFS